MDAAGPRVPGRRPFRPDIEGLRAVAVLLVVAFHAGVPFVPGGFVGVDVFFVISGFLITGLLVDELERTGSLSLRSFYARRARRLLPLAALVLVAVAVGMQLFTPPVFRPAVRFDAISAAFYYSNWQFALESVNYLTLGGAQNPVLHYWSLSVEEQFYVAWPLLLLLATRFRRGAGPTNVRRRCTAIVAIVGGASLACSVVETAAQPAIAYFETTTRVWEFAAGAGLALAAGRLGRIRPLAATGCGLLGLAAVSLAVLSYGPTTQFPGTAAIVPVAGALMILAAGLGQPLRGVGALLSVRPLVYIGRISYAWYLWHWPCLVFARTARWAPADGSVSWTATVIAVAVSFALAVTTHLLIEQPARRARWFAVDRRRVLLLASSATAAAVIALAISGGPFVVPGNADASSSRPAAATPLEAQASTAYAAMHGCHVGYGATTPAPSCVFGDTTATRTVVLLGDSHAAQWFPALQIIAQREHFRLIAWTKSGCPLVTGVHIYLPAIGRDYTECGAWSRDVLRRLAVMPRPAIVVVARTSTYLPQVLGEDGQQTEREDAPALWGAGSARAISQLRRDAHRVILLRDTPHAGADVPGCISWDPESPARCDFARGAPADAGEYAAERAAGVPRTVYADPTAAVCPGAICRAQVGGVITYRDDNHLTAAFAASRWRRFAQALSLTDNLRPI